MKLSEIQSYVAGLLADVEMFEDVVILEDDGSYPKTPHREEALRETGLCLLVWQVDGDQVVGDVAPTGMCVYRVNIAVIVEELVSKNRSGEGTGITAEQAVEAVLSAVSGKPSGGPPNRPILPSSPPFSNLGTTNGVRRVAVTFTHDCSITPS